MATNLHFDQKRTSEQNLYEDITIESLKMFGQDVYYLPRTIVNEDRVWGDDVPSKFSSSYKVEMYLENTDGFDGEGDLFTRFGVEIRDQATFVVARRRWKNTISRYDNEINSERPREGDLIYLPLSNSLFQVMHVEHEQPFYQLRNLVTYKLRCELFEYSDEDLDTGVDAVDKIEQNYAYEYRVKLDSSSGGFFVGENVTSTLSDGTIISGEISHWSDSDNVASLIHVGANDGKFHTLVTGRQLVGTLATDDEGNVSVAGIIEIMNDDNQISQNEQNKDFSTISSDFLDFSEDNPFGDPENN
tara:strand:- start:2491 stop:3396 length:906 start_codon:yes stop_codon:yes gene_type:complete